MKPNFILFTTKSNNYYLYSFNINQILLLHPILYHILLLYKNGIDLSIWLKSIKTKNKIEGIGNCSKKEILNHYNKYLFLLSNGYFDKNMISRYRYNSDDINYFLSNTRSLTFEVTEKCNLSCDYCVYGKFYSNRTSCDKSLSIETAKIILDYLFKKWTSTLNSSFDRKISIGFYGGEALLCYEFIYEIVNYIKKSRLFAQNQIEFSMTTNGVLLKRYISFLVENDFNLLISMDGGTEINNSYRRFHNKKSAFDIIYNNILEIKNRYPKYFENNINFLSVLHNRNSSKEIIEFFQSNFNKKPGISELATDSINPEYKDEFWEMYQVTESISNNSENINEETTIKEQSRVDFEGLIKFISAYSGYVKDTYADLLVKSKEKSYVPTATCKPFSRMIFITAEGKILPCERIGHQYELGYVNENEINIDFNKIADKINSYLNTLYYELCKDCVHQFQCNTCLFHTNVGNKDFHCDEFIQYTETDISSIFSNYMFEIENNPNLYLRVTKFKSI